MAKALILKLFFPSKCFLAEIYVYMYITQRKNDLISFIHLEEKKKKKSPRMLLMSR